MKISMHTHPVIHIDREQRLDRINIFIISLSLKALQILISTIEHTVSSSALNVNLCHLLCLILFQTVEFTFFCRTEDILKNAGGPLWRPLYGQKKTSFKIF